MDVRTWISRQLDSHHRRDVEEAAKFRAMGPEERSQVLRSLSRSAFNAVLSLPKEQRQRALEHRDPMPMSSVLAWIRLRKARGSSTAGR